MLQSLFKARHAISHCRFGGDGRGRRRGRRRVSLRLRLLLRAEVVVVGAAVVLVRRGAMVREVEDAGGGVTRPRERRALAVRSVRCVLVLL